MLIYDTNIKGGTLKLSETGVLGKDTEKRQYIKGFKRPAVAGPAILVNRGHGNNYKFDFVWIPTGTDFYAENHVNMIQGPEPALKTIFESLGDSRTAEFVKKFFGNGAISKTELETVLPIWTSASSST